MTREEAIKHLQCMRDEAWSLQGALCYINLESIKALDMAIEAPSADAVQGWNNHEVACMLAELFGDACACNYNCIDEWLPMVCDFKDNCPNTVGVACWEQFLKHYERRKP